jgi:Rrf2 family transcriptional regulator, iron-sulfur cluster assembly transcription factor
VTLSKRGSYAAAAAICLARAYPSGQPKKLREISAEMDIPRAFAAQILANLVHAGIAVSAFGRGGGHRLARPPAQVSVAEVIEAAEGPLASERCALGDGPCRWQDVCPLHETMTKATASLRQVLASTSLAVLAERDAAIALGAYPIPADAHPHAAAVTITDSVQVELPAAVIAARLRAGTSWLTAHAEACDEEEEARIRVGPGSPGWLGKTMAVHLGEPADVEGSLVIPFIWESAGPGGMFPRFEGEMRLISIDPDRSEFRLSGRYRPPPGKPGQVLNDALLTRVAKATVRSFLRRTASGLEEQHANADLTRVEAHR